jgi:hypothetical protein
VHSDQEENDQSAQYDAGQIRAEQQERAPDHARLPPCRDAEPRHSERRNQGHRDGDRDEGTTRPEQIATPRSSVVG